MYIPNQRSWAKLVLVSFGIFWFDLNFFMFPNYRNQFGFAENWFQLLFWLQSSGTRDICISDTLV